jgi:multiple antibiotic resistance protein
MSALAPAEFGVLAFSSLFAMINPISAAPIFVQLTSKRVEMRKKTAMRASMTALITLGLFATAGGAIFAFFGITVPAFQIAGGLLFLISSLRVLQGLPDHEDAEESDLVDPSVVPIGIPLIAGAGSISTVMVLAGQARGHLHQVALGSAILVNSLITLLILLLAPAIVAKLGNSGQGVMSKVMGLLTAVIGVQFILNGASSVILDLIQHAGK